MNRLSKCEIAQLLFEIRSKKDVEDFLDRLQVDQGGGYRWVPVGGRPANAGTIQLATEAAPPLVERVTNAIDAVIERHKAEVAFEEECPSSPREAVGKWWGVSGGHLASLSTDQIQRLADDIEVTIHESGEPKAPTVTVRDRGIGQHPSDFPSTLLSLGESNKIGKYYLCGAYGQGGASTYWWCEYSIIISRRCPEHSLGKLDMVGWTIVRPNRENYAYKTTVYEYLVCNDGKIPTFDPSALNGMDFDYGTSISHIQYQLDRYARRMTLVSYRLFNSLLFDPVLPFWLRDARYHENRTIYGNFSRLERSENVEYSNQYIAELPDDGILTIRYWVMKVKPASPKDRAKFYLDSYLDREKSPKTVAITLNGQTHGYLLKSDIKEKTKLGFLADYLIVHIDCDQLSLQMKRDLFAAHRGHIREGENRLELISEKVVAALITDKKLDELEQKRREDHLSSMSEESEREVRKLLDRLIEQTRLDYASGEGLLSGNGRGVGGSQPFIPNDPPTYLEFLGNLKSIRIAQGDSRRVVLETDGPDDLFVRKHNRASLAAEFSSGSGLIAEIGSFRNGRIPVKIHCPPTISVGTTIELIFGLEMDNLNPPLKASLKCTVVEPPKPYAPNDPPTLLRIANRKHPIPLRCGRKNAITIEFDGSDDILTRPRSKAHFSATCSIPGVTVSEHRGPKDGRIQVYVEVSENVHLGLIGVLNCTLTLSSGKQLMDERQCTIVALEDKESKHFKATQRRRPKPAYEIVAVRRDDNNWDRFGWDETNVGKYEESEDILCLFVNIDHIELQREIGNLTRKGRRPQYLDRFRKRYIAHIAYHMYLISKGFKEIRVPSTTGDHDEEASINTELQRVAKTLILLMLPEQELAVTGSLI